MVQFDRNLKLPGISGRQTPAGKPTDGKQLELYNACKDFETVMTKQMLTAMQGSTPLFGKGFGGEYFQDLFQDQLARNISTQGIGLGDMLYRQLAKILPPDAVNATGNQSVIKKSPAPQSPDTDSQIKTDK